MTEFASRRNSPASGPTPFALRLRVAKAERNFLSRIEENINLVVRSASKCNRPRSFGEEAAGAGGGGQVKGSGDNRLSRQWHYHGPGGLNGRVRNGNGWGPAGIVTGMAPGRGQANRDRSESERHAGFSERDKSRTRTQCQDRSSVTRQQRNNVLKADRSGGSRGDPTLIHRVRPRSREARQTAPRANRERIGSCEPLCNGCE